MQRISKFVLHTVSERIYLCCACVAWCVCKRMHVSCPWGVVFLFPVRMFKAFLHKHFHWLQSGLRHKVPGHASCCVSSGGGQLPFVTQLYACHTFPLLWHTLAHVLTQHNILRTYNGRVFAINIAEWNIMARKWGLKKYPLISFKQPKCKSNSRWIKKQMTCLYH